MRTHFVRLRAALALLLVGSGLLFGVGSTVERNQHHAEQHRGVEIGDHRSLSRSSMRSLTASFLMRTGGGSGTF